MRIANRPVCPSGQDPGTIQMDGTSATFEFWYNDDHLSGAKYFGYIKKHTPDCSAELSWPVPSPGQQVTYYYSELCLHTRRSNKEDKDSSGFRHCISVVHVMLTMSFKVFWNKGKAQCCFPPVPEPYTPPGIVDPQPSNLESLERDQTLDDIELAMQNSPE